MPGARTTSCCSGWVGLVLALVLWTGSARSEPLSSLSLHDAEPTPSGAAVAEEEWAARLAGVLGLTAGLPAEPTPAELFSPALCREVRAGPGGRGAGPARGSRLPGGSGRPSPTQSARPRSSRRLATGHRALPARRGGRGATALGDRSGAGGASGSVAARCRPGAHAGGPRVRSPRDRCLPDSQRAGGPHGAGGLPKFLRGTRRRLAAGSPTATRCFRAHSGASLRLRAPASPAAGRGARDRGGDLR